MMKSFLLQLLLAVLFAINPPEVLAETDQEAPTQEDIESISSEIEELNSMLQQLNKERSAAEQRLGEIESEMIELRSITEENEDELAEGERRLKKLSDRQQTLVVELEEKRQLMSSLLRAVYLFNLNDRITLILNQKEPEDISRYVAYLKYLQDAQVDAIEHFQATLNEINRNRQDQLETNNRMKRTRHTLERNREELLDAQKSRKKLIAQLDRKYKNSKDQLSSLEKQQRIMAALLAKSIAKQASGKSITTLRGELPWPIQGEVRGKFGQQRSSLGVNWQGLLIAADNGAEVSAIFSGQVIFSDWLRGYGRLVIVDHGNDYLSLYAHNEQLTKNEGDWVVAGETVALSGQTGGLQSPGLYLELRHEGQPVDPEPWLAPP